MLAVQLGYGWLAAIKVVAVLAVVPVGALLYVYFYLFKMVSHMQSRLGPMEAGPHGVLQAPVELLKFLQKEDLFPERADKFVFGAAPFVVFLSTFLLFVIIPTGPRLVAENLDTGVFFALAVSSISVIGILMAGWASANKYSVTGGLRAAGQLIAYELPMVLAIVGVVVQAGTMSLQGIVHAQANGKIFGWGGIGNPFVFTQIVGFVIFFIAAQAELTQTPFDMPVAESELVAGYLTEYSGVRFLLFFMAEFASAFAFAAIASTIFLGGWYVPGVHGTAADLLGPVVMIAKTMAVGFVIFWVRFTFPRFREDQLQSFAWKFLIPISLLNILVTGILKVVF
ncbi:MAG: NADH-quinone oxidoreductase subunit H [Actinobacteria bacterium]|nr:NADH-quinone oxidoreductase subunit H [Actinomycetota bacterium]